MNYFIWKKMFLFGLFFSFLFSITLFSVKAQFAGTMGIGFVNGGQISFAGLPFIFSPGKGATGTTGNPITLNVSLTPAGDFSDPRTFLAATYSIDNGPAVSMNGIGGNTVTATIGALSSGYHTIKYYFGIKNGGNIVIFPSIPVTFSIISPVASPPSPTAIPKGSDGYSPATINNFSVYTTTISYGDTVTVSWSASSLDTRQCFLTVDDDNDPPNTNAWLQAYYLDVSGTKTTKVFNGPRMNDINFVTFSLSCTGKGSHAQGFRTISVPVNKPIVSPVQVTITATPSTISAGRMTTLSWSTSGSTGISCVGTGGDKEGNWWDGLSLSGNGTSNKVINTPGVYTYGVICTDSAGMKAAAVTSVNVTPELPRAVLDIDPSLSIPSGSGVTLLWTGIKADTCETSWAGPDQPNQGSSYTGALIGPKTETYWVDCSNAGGKTGRISKTVTVAAPVVTCSPFPPQQQTVTCPANQSGGGVKTRTSSCPDPYGTPVWGGWSSVPSCTPNPPTCSPSSVQQTLTCPTNQSGSITQTKTSTCPDPYGTPVWGSFVTTSNTCTPNPVTCTPSSQQQTVTCLSNYTGGGTQTRSSTCPDPYGTPVWGSWSAVAPCTENPATCTPSSQQQTLACPTNQSGAISQTRTSTCPDSYGTPLWGVWSTTDNTCVSNPPTCSPSTQQQTLACPTGQTGSIVQTKTSTCPNPYGTPVWGGFVTTSNTCVANSATCEATTQSRPSSCPTNFTGSATESRSSTCPDPYGTPVWGSWTNDTSSCVAQIAVVQNTNVDLTPAPTPARVSTLPITPPAPVINFTADPIRVEYNGSSVLTWSATNATECHGSGGAWTTGDKGLTGAKTFSNLINDQTYTLACSGEGGLSSKTAVISIGPRTTTPQTSIVQTTITPPQPIKASLFPVPKLTFTLESSKIVRGSPVTLIWVAQNTDYCTASGDWGQKRSSSGRFTTEPLTSSKNYLLECSGPGGKTSGSVNINIDSAAAPGLKFTVASKIVYGKPVTLTWTSTNTLYCTASGDWSGSQNIAGTFTTEPITSSKRFKLICTGQSGKTGSEIKLNLPETLNIVNRITVPTPKSSIPSTDPLDKITFPTSTKKVVVPAAVKVKVDPLRKPTILQVSTKGISDEDVTPTVDFGYTTKTVLGLKVITLKWDTKNITSCTASGEWTGFRPVSGSEVVSKVVVGKKYILTCNPVSEDFTPIVRFVVFK